MKKYLGLNALLNAVRQSLSIVFPLITFPYVSRVLGSVEFGRYSFSSSIISYFSLFAAYGISAYGIREGSGIRDDRAKLSALASDLFSFNLLTSMLSIVALFSLIFFNAKIKSYAVLLSIQALEIVLTSIGMDWINNVYEDFFYITVRYVAVQIFALICIFIFVRDAGDTAKYCFILVCGSYGGNLINLLYIRKYISFPRFHIPPIREHIVPLTVLFINSMATTIYVNSDITMLGLYLDDGGVGIYGFSSKIYNILKYFINSAIVVTIPRLGYMLKNDTSVFKPFIARIQRILSLFIFPIATGLFFLSDSIVSIAGGTEYMQGVPSLQILSLSLIFALFGSVNTNCILLINRQEKKVLAATVTSAAINICLNLILIPKVGIAGAALTTVIAEAVNYIIQSYYSKKLFEIEFCLRGKECFQIAAGCLISILIILLSKMIWSDASGMNHLMRILFSVGLSVIAYYSFLSLTKNEFIVEINRYLMRKTLR